jgi:hypothetical protein
MATIDDLTTATTELLSAVNVAKATLDQAVDDATEQAILATSNGAAQVVLAAEQVTLAADQADLATSNGAAQVTLAAAQVTLATEQADAAKLQADIVAASASLVLPNRVNTIGIPGAAGFGVGICPSLPAGFTALPGHTDPMHANYGNYQFSDGSIMVWVPKFWYRLAHASNPTFAVHGVNSCDVRGLETYTSTTDANADGYAVHRAFIDGGLEQPGFFIDKYLASKTAKGTGFVASSVANGLPLSTSSAHNPIAEITASPVNQYYSALNAAKGRSGTNGALDAASPFFCCSLPIYAALALLSVAHGQAATATTYCAWYSAATTNFPKGCNNNALKDTNDTTVVWESDGYSNCGKTGSAGFGGGAGNLFAKSTHNGQNCGIADINGNLWEIATGMTCVATSKTITAATQANPCVLTIVGHGFADGKLVQCSGIVGMTQLNDKIYTLTVIDADSISINVDASAFTAYSSGGTAISGRFYVSKPGTRMRDFTSGATLASDHWGATGVAAMMEEIVPPMFGAFAMRWGNAGNQVLSAALSGDGYRLTGFGLPQDVAAFSAAGSNLFGTDYYYQYVRDQLCPIGGGRWGGTTNGGVWSRGFDFNRTRSADTVGFRCAYYL